MPTAIHYVGSVKKIHHADNTQEWRRYIHDSVMITQVLSTSGSVTATRTQFLLKDHLGSVNAITDGAGKIADLLAFDPWGKRRAESNWASLSVSATQSNWFVGAKPKTSRGFTGHQMADEMEIIHMGGRIYDPLLGRFLQADPFIQSPSTTASLNRYSYVWNNPLNATDPSGFILSKLWKEVRPFVGAIVGVVLAVYAPWAAEAWAPIVIGMISGAAGAAANGTSIFKGAMFGAFSGVAVAAGGAWGAAIWGGTESYMNGGAFGRGFIAAGIGAYGGRGAGGPSPWGFVRSAVLGGVATEVTGGKFKNGAASAAFMYAVSSAVASGNTKEVNSTEGDERTRENTAAFQKELDKLAEDGTLSQYRNFESSDAAAKEVLGVTAPLSKKYGLEVGGNIWQDKNGWRYTLPKVGGPGSVGVSTSHIEYHTHPHGELMFSNRMNNHSGNFDGGDSSWVATANKPLYVGVQHDGIVKIGVCDPGNCSHVGRKGTSPSRIIQ